MVGAFLRTFFGGLDIKCGPAAYVLLNDWDGEGYGMEKKRLSVRPIMLGLATAMGAYLVLLTLAAYLTSDFPKSALLIIGSLDFGFSELLTSDFPTS